MFLRTMICGMVLVLLVLAGSLSSREIIFLKQRADTTTIDPDFMHHTTRAWEPHKIHKREHHFTFPNSDLCPRRGEKLRLLILVASAIPNGEMREAARLSWGHFARMRKVAYAFVLGNIDKVNRSLKGKVKKEILLNKDIIVGTFNDTPQNQPLKTLSMLRWVNEYCPKVKKVMKADDDVFINIPNVLNFITDPRRENATGSIYGRASLEVPVVQHVGWQRYVPLVEFNRDAFYLNFANNAAYIITTDVVQVLLQALPHELYAPAQEGLVIAIIIERMRMRKEFHRWFVVPYEPSIEISCIALKSLAIHLNGHQYHLFVRKKISRGIMTGHCRN